MKRVINLNLRVKDGVDDNKIFLKFLIILISLKLDTMYSIQNGLFKIFISFIDISYEKECLDNLNKRKSFYKNMMIVHPFQMKNPISKGEIFQINQNVIDYSGKWKEPENIEIVQKIMSYPNVLDLMNKIGYL